MVLTHREDDLKITIDGPAESPSRLLVTAISRLIAEADVDGHDADADDDLRFYDGVLLALVSHYAIHAPFPGNVTVKEVATALLEDCSRWSQSRLNVSLGTLRDEIDD